MDRSQIPEVFLIDVDPNAIQSYTQIERNGQDPQAVVLPQMGISIEHSPSQRRHLVRRLNFDVHQRQPLVRLFGLPAGLCTTDWQLADQVQGAALTFRRVWKYFLIQPLDRRDIKPLRPD